MATITEPPKETVKPYCDNCSLHNDSCVCETKLEQVDNVNHPPHYTGHPSGVECIEVTEHMGFCVGNAIKYLWRADLKANAIEDLKKASWYIQREIERREQTDR